MSKRVFIDFPGVIEEPTANVGDILEAVSLKSLVVSSFPGSVAFQIRAVNDGLVSVVEVEIQSVFRARIPISFSCFLKST